MAYQDSSLMISPKQDCSLQPVQPLLIIFCTQEQRLKERKCIIDPQRSLEELKLKSESRRCEVLYPLLFHQMHHIFIIFSSPF